MSACTYCLEHISVIERDLCNYLNGLQEEGAKATELIISAFGPSLWLYEHFECYLSVLCGLVVSKRVIYDQETKRYFIHPQTRSAREQLLNASSERVKKLQAELSLQHRLMVAIVSPTLALKMKGESE